MAARAAHDERDHAAADAARTRLRTGGTPTLAPDARISPLLARDERVVARRTAARLDLGEPPPGGPSSDGVIGDLYVTSRRLVLVGPVTVAFDLEAIEDGVVAGERLLLILRDGDGVTLAVDRPRLLLVEIASARLRGRNATRLEMLAGVDQRPAR